MITRRGPAPHGKRIPRPSFESRDCESQTRPNANPLPVFVSNPAGVDCTTEGFDVLVEASSGHSMSAFAVGVDKLPELPLRTRKKVDVDARARAAVADAEPVWRWRYPRSDGDVSPAGVLVVF